MMLLSKNSETIAYSHINNHSNYSVLFCGGLGSTMEGSKVCFIENFCKSNNLTFTKFDYYGHGKSTGDFILGNISTWFNDTLAIIKACNLHKFIVIGASLGGWIMLLLALHIPHKVIGLIGLAAAPDFTEDIYNSLSLQQQNNLQAIPLVNYFPEKNSSNHYTISSQLILDGKNHLILNKAVLPIQCPIRLLHGLNDNIVSYQKSIEVVKKLPTNSLFQLILNSSEHTMNDSDSLLLLETHLKDLINLANKIYI